MSLWTSFALACGLVAGACDAAPPVPPASAAMATPPQAPAPAAAEVDAPRLVVVIVVDQMRTDYLERFAHLYEDGLDRLRRGGAWFRGAEIAHGVTMTGPGHASLATATHPSGHGILQNDWIDRSSGARAYAVADPEGTIVGPRGHDTAGLEGRSPLGLRRSTIGTWLKGSSPASQVVAIAYKDRASVLMAGETADGAYWYEPALAAYVTSSAFATGLPPWVEEFNSSNFKSSPGLPESWERALPPAAYDFIGPDAVAAEGAGEASQFPHRLRVPGEPVKAAFYRFGASPMSDALTFDLAARALEGAGLGADASPDLLLLSLSGADLVGHAFGPDSHEIVDYYVRLDRALGDLLRELDRRLPGAYTVVLTSDHGGAPLPEVARAGAYPHAQRILSDDFRREVTAATARACARLGLPPPAVEAIGEALWLDLAAARAAGVTEPTLRATVADELRRLAFVADAFTYEELAAPEAVAEPRRPWARRLGRSFVADRSPDIQLLPPPGWLLNARATGTSHGTPYDYDTRVPILFYGQGIPAATIDGPVFTVDIAPTIADLVGAAIPPAIDGRSLLPQLRGAAAGE